MKFYEPCNYTLKLATGPVEGELGATLVSDITDNLVDKARTKMVIAKIVG